MSTAPITPPNLEGLSPLANVERAPKPQGELGEAFTKALVEARQLDHDATQTAEQFAAGKPDVGMHEVIIASEKANIALRYATTLKNKALEAYRELINTPV